MPKKAKKANADLSDNFNTTDISNEDNKYNENSEYDQNGILIKTKDKLNNRKTKKTKIDPILSYNETMKWFKQFEENPNDIEIYNNNEKNKNIPWVEKYRPGSLNEIVSQTHAITSIKKFVKNRQLPHLLLYGQSGVGKTSTIMACAKEMYGDNYSIMVLNINASEERGIDVIRGKIKDFVSTKGIYTEDTTNYYKLVILDEADAITSDAQAMLRRVIENHTENVRFCLICNNVKKINYALQSRCTCFKFSPLKIGRAHV
jgi:DNA replication protein DnaC